MKPLSPGEVEGSILHTVHDAMVDTVNYLLRREINCGEARLFQAEIISKFKTNRIGWESLDQFHWDFFASQFKQFNRVFGSVGWEVTYPSGGYNWGIFVEDSSFEHRKYFLFRKKEK